MNSNTETRRKVNYTRLETTGRKALGNVTNLRTPPKGADTEEAISDRRKRRYSLQRQSQWLLRGHRRMKRNGEEAPYRVEMCMVASREGNGVQIVKTTEGAKYAGVAVCGSIWHCPVCAARISNERRKDIRAAVVAAEAQGFKAILVTYTARHDQTTDLAEQLDAMTKAHESVWRGAAAERLKSRCGVLGMIRTLELTHSKRNGWHTHIHAIVFINIQTDTQAFSDALRDRWEVSAAKHGLSMNEHGFDAVDSSEKVADYIAKWGHEPKWTESDELARWHTKTGHKRGYAEHLTPWQLLEFSANGDDQAGELFAEYAMVFHGRKQVHWSRDLRELLGLGEELTDEEAAEKEMEEAAEVLTVQLTEEDWRSVVANDARSELLDLVERCETFAEIQAECLANFGFCPELCEV